VVPEYGAAHGEIEQVLRAACARQLPRHKQPSEFWLVDEMPLGPTGKISRRLLKESVTAPS
jgi:acyl-CoA synthetase (AMP-forming)/AMP-acid ligase II